mmetsp:Transcript_44358/g.48046  ORF Transcript_44358/g.48046 Transcript_44358/m.48046 type:complete len:175 (+) Transcript_44358:62-586(+)
MSGIQLVSSETKKHPKFGTSIQAKNIKTKKFTIGKLAIALISEEWYCEGDTDVEIWIEMGHLRFDMSLNAFHNYTDSRMSMSRGKYNEIVCLLITKIKEGNKDQGSKDNAIEAFIEEGSASKMNAEWIKLATTSKLSVQRFNDCMIGEFGIFWFGGVPFLPGLAVDTDDVEDYW